MFSNGLRKPGRDRERPSTKDQGSARIHPASSKMRTGSIRLSRRGTGGHVSITPIGAPRQKITVATLREKKLHHQPITCLTAYDYASARLVDEASIDVILVGDSLAQTMLGYENTLSVTVDEMLHHTRAVRRGVKHAFLVADMPYGSFHVTADEAIRNATRFVKEAGAEAVKMEGGEKRATSFAA